MPKRIIDIVAFKQSHQNISDHLDKMADQLRKIETMQDGIAGLESRDPPQDAHASMYGVDLVMDQDTALKVLGEQFDRELAAYNALALDIVKRVLLIDTQ